MGWPDPPPGPRDRGAALRRGPGRRLPAAERRAHDVRDPARGRASGSTPATRPAATVSTHYDAMLAKVIAHAPTREAAARKLAGVLSRARIHGVRHQPRPARRRPARRAGSSPARCPPTFLAGLDVELVADLDAGSARRRRRRSRWPSVDREARTVQRGIPVAWRNVVSQPQVTEFEDGDQGRVVGRPGRLRRRRTQRSSRRARPSVTLEARRRPDDVRRGRRSATRVDVDWPRRPRRAAGVRRGSSTRPTRWPAAACWRRCPAPSSASRSSRGSRSRPASRCSSSRR